MTSAVAELLGPPPLTMDEIAEWCRISKGSAYELVKPGPNGEPPKLKSHRVGNGGGAIRVHVADFKAFLEASGSDGAAAIEEPPVKRKHAIPRKVGTRGGKRAG